MPINHCISRNETSLGFLNFTMYPLLQKLVKSELEAYLPIDSEFLQNILKQFMSVVSKVNRQIMKNLATPSLKL